MTEAEPQVSDRLTDDEVDRLTERAEVWEKVDWLAPPEGDTWSLPWVEQLRREHVEAVHALAEAMRDLSRLRSRQEAADKSYRQAVVKAIANGEPTPQREDTDDDVVKAAKVQVCEDFVEQRGEEVAELVLDVLAQLRLRLADLEGIEFRQAVGTALERGPGAFTERRRRILTEQLRLARGGGIVTIDENAPLDPELQEVP
jgi:hypothetical protein